MRWQTPTPWSPVSAGAVDIIVTGDHRFRDLGAFRGIDILTPGETIGRITS